MSTKRQPTPSEALYRLSRLNDAARHAIDKRDAYVQVARAAGVSWSEIGQVLGITKQAAWERYRGTTI